MVSNLFSQESMCVCVAIPFILDVRLVDVPAGVTKEEGHTGFLYISFCCACLDFSLKKDSAVLSLIYCEVEFCVPTN